MGTTRGSTPTAGFPPRRTLPLPPLWTDRAVCLPPPLRPRDFTEDPMSRPASLRSSASPFVRRKEKKGSEKLGLDWERVHESYNHRFENDMNLNTLQHLRRDLMEAEEVNGPHSSKARKIRRLINQELEQGLMIQATWCGGCRLVLHLCRCKSRDQVLLGNKEAEKKRQIREEVTRRLRVRQGLSALTHSEQRRLRREAKEAANG